MAAHPSTVDLAAYRRRRHPTASCADRIAATKQTDAQVCTCGHRCAAHGSYLDGALVGIGQGPCGWPQCSCDHFAASGAHSEEPFVPVPDYSRTPAVEDRTCPDCHAEPGEPCHWACSSWWA
jgi:hypothetical protein